jgi:hypothetical protein
MTEEEIERTLNEINIIRAKRTERDFWAFSYVAMTAARGLHEAFCKWFEEEMNALKNEADLITPYAVGEATRQLEGLKQDLVKAKEEFSKCYNALTQFVNDMSEEKIKTVKEFLERFQRDVMPSFGLIGMLLSFRERLDIMADMIPRRRPSPF